MSRSGWPVNSSISMKGRPESVATSAGLFIGSSVGALLMAVNAYVAIVFVAVAFLGLILVSMDKGESDDYRTDREELPPAS